MSFHAYSGNNDLLLTFLANYINGFFIPNPMYVIKSALKDAEKVKKFIADNNLFEKGHKIKKDENFIYFPVLKKDAFSGFDVEIVDEELDVLEEDVSFKEKIKSVLDEEELEKLKTAFDVIGDIAILEMDEDLVSKEKKIAEIILEEHKNINTVVKKKGIHKGEFRTQDVVFLAGEDKKETVHRENNVVLKLDVSKVYFSPRLSTERKRIYEQVSAGENVLVMFSGCAPYPCVISKNTEAKEIIGVEINPAGHDYGEENVSLNKLGNVDLINGDVNEVVPNMETGFDRVLMPLPKSAENFLDVALSAIKDKGVVHFYDFLHEEEFFKAHEKIKKACSRKGLGFEVLSTVKCGQHAPHVFRICVDFKVKYTG